MVIIEGVEDQEQVKNIVERFRNNLANDGFEYEGQEIKFTASIGVSRFFGDNYQEIFKQADLAASYAKGEVNDLEKKNLSLNDLENNRSGEEGRNRTVFYDPKTKKFSLVAD